MPLLPLRDIVIFPHMIVPLFVGRDKSVNALDAVMRTDKRILLLAQRQADIDDPTASEMYDIGVIGNILQLLRLPDGTMKILVEGCERVTISDIQEDTNLFLTATYTIIESEQVDETVLESTTKSLLNEFETFAKLNKKIAPEVLTSVAAVDSPDKLADTIASHLNLQLEQKQALLETVNTIDRLELLYGFMEQELDMLEIDKRIRSRVKRQMEKGQREYYLSEQMKAIQKELGEDDATEMQMLEKKIYSIGMPKEIQTKSLIELKRLKGMPFGSSEANVIRNYLDWIVELPWKKRSRLYKDLNIAESALNDDHHGLEKVKEHILEYLAVLNLVKQMKGSILCLVGPPGVGKTSLAHSIAKATGRKFARISLGGVRDEAEIRGHRRTYIGALPGKIIQAMKKVGAKNPLILLDEIDKMGSDSRGDPASALLEVLDPEQNHNFNDHFLEVDYDLSEVMFVTTANGLNIPGPLRDRMEIIRIAGYTEDEKLAIAKQYLLPKQRSKHGLPKNSLNLSDATLRDIIRYYTRESGVRELSRMLAKLCRKVARKHVQSKDLLTIEVSQNDLNSYLGVHIYRYGIAEEKDQIGVVTGLAWTEVGGELLQIEAALMPGKGKLIITGQLGKVMQESIQAAFTYVRSRAINLGLQADFYQKVDIHVHVPEGAIPKDGPSAGLAMATAIVSILIGVPVRKEVCMTGEINLRGNALAIGGLKEKMLAAHRGGLTHVIIPEDNRKDLKEIPENILAGLSVHVVSHMDEVLKLSLANIPESVTFVDNFVPTAISDIYLASMNSTAH
ncbi:MAG: endopeptidase La [Zetaproteobacteria bacterium]|nr:endopeptidase La [Zetaproteobacteria bacterium]